MGQFIKFGLCTKIVCPAKEKNKIDKYYKSFNEFISDFEKQTQLKTELFDLSEKDDGYVFTLKDEFLAHDSLNSFLKDFFCDIYNGEDLKIYCDDIYQDIKTKNSIEELIEFAAEKPHQNFQLSESRCSVIAPCRERIYLEYEYIVLFLNGKAYMECYSELFSYMERLLRLRHAHSQVWAMKIFLD